jgi:hypothetical protein
MKRTATTDGKYLRYRDTASTHEPALEREKLTTSSAQAQRDFIPPDSIHALIDDLFMLDRGSVGN